MMRLSPGELASRAADGTSLRLKFLAALSVAGLLLFFAAYLILGSRSDAQTDERVDNRADEISTLVGTSLRDNGQLDLLVDEIARFGDVQSLAVADLDRGEIVAESGPTASGTLESVIQTGTPAQDQLPAVELRPVTSGGRYLVAIELDRSVIGADFESGMYQGLAVLFIGLLLLLAVAYGLVTFGVTRPLERLSTLRGAPTGAGDSANGSRRPTDEIARLDHDLERMMASGTATPQPAPVPGYVLAETLPDIWVRLDADLNVLESRLDEAGGDQAAELGIGHVSDLLSPDIVQYLAETVETLKPGDEDAFEFAIGVRVYQAHIQAGKSDFTLELSEGQPGTIEAEDPNVAAAAVLGELLEHLPVGVLEADARGVIRYANRGLFGAGDAQSLLGRAVVDVLPPLTAEAGRRAMRDAHRMGEPQSFDIPPDPARQVTGTTNHVVATESDEGTSYFMLAIEMPVHGENAQSSPDARALEEQLWALELQISNYEEQIGALTGDLERAQLASDGDTLAAASLVDDISAPMSGVLSAMVSIGGNEKRRHDRASMTALETAVTALAHVLDEQLGTRFLELSESTEASQSRRFHLATLLDEIAIEASARDRLTGSRISAFVQPSLPKSLYGSETDCRTAIHQMIEFARLVSAERPLILAAMQDASTGKLIQVRFEIQIPPPKLEDDDIAVLRGCISGELPDGDVPSSLRSILEGDQDDFAPLDIELVTINDEATVLRCSASFELAEDVEAEHSWVRGLRTLIIQDAESNDNGIQSALSAFGIMGYVVTSEKDLVEALKIAEEYSNPYRLVIADVDTTDLESFVGQLFDGDAPVVLVGKDSESAMVGAISAGYSGYIAKPVRQVDLLEVILSTVEPPAHLTSSHSAETAA